MRALFFTLFAAVATAGAAGVLVYSDHAPRALRCLLPTLLALAGICVLQDAAPVAALLVLASALLMAPAMPLALRLRAAYPENWKTKITPGFQVFVGALLAAAFLNFAFRVHDFGAADAVIAVESVILLSALLLAIGAFGVLTCNNFFAILLSVVLMLAASGPAFVAFDGVHESDAGRLFAWLTWGFTFLFAGVGGALVGAFFKDRASIDIDNAELVE